MRGDASLLGYAPVNSHFIVSWKLTAPKNNIQDFQADVV